MLQYRTTILVTYNLFANSIFASSQQSTLSTKLIGIHLSKLSFCQVAVVTSLDSVGIVVGEHLALLAMIKVKHLALPLAARLLFG